MVSIRQMAIEDYELVYDLWIHTPGMGLNTADDSKEGIARYLKRNPTTCFVAESGNKVVGALLAGLLYQKIQRLPAAFVGEVVGTGILGAMLSYPVAVLLMGKTSALFAFVPSFMINTVAGSIVAVLVLCALERTHILRTLRAGLH